jgi:hypothetical protein
MSVCSRRYAMVATSDSVFNRGMKRLATRATSSVRLTSVTRYALIIKTSQRTFERLTKLEANLMKCSCTPQTSR